jgi:hypothetical protein
MRTWLFAGFCMVLVGCGTAPGTSEPLSPVASASPSPEPSPSSSPTSCPCEVVCSILGIPIYEGTVSAPITGDINGCYTFTDSYGPVTICADCEITPQ